MNKFDPSKYCLITCHGFTGYPEEMEPLGLFFQEKGMTWRNLQLPGHGTTPEDLKNTTWVEWTKYVKEEVISAMEEFGNNVIMSGLSLGGALTLYVLEEIPDVKAGIALAAPIKVLSWFHYPLLLIPFLRFWIKSDEEDIHDPEALKIHRSYPKFHSSSGLEVHKLVTYTRKNLSKIHQPLFLAHSKLDTVVNPKQAKQIFQKVSTPNHLKKLVFVEKSGHVLTRDYDKVFIFQQAFNFLANVLDS